MSKPWKPGRQTVELQPSRIRREPPPPPGKQTVLRETDDETWTVVLGVLAFALAITFLIFWFSDYTSK